ncbi:alpha/beta-hydrolase [Neolentinus lepideus HHB14362 ss-1]|uniref:Alpha/beta-hydrolase n=1 Tax=Neolentinus lepideus HHB14362 ss-1 TaxID=1314782 RepID=A0A165MKL8_9AGAM|nr:alpha/beta-hydrolase [Neolentinus lepideus HHB14362 ss-1]
MLPIALHCATFLFSVFGLVGCLLTGGSDSLVVSTTSGTFKGFSTGNGTERWLGIPYAQPPVGSLRFKAPVPITSLASDIVNATSFGLACPQVPSAILGAAMGEDCLTDAALPVLVWFYVNPSSSYMLFFRN